jgi:hypothetical protein
MGSIVAMLVGKKVFGTVIGERAARAIATTAVVIVILLLGASVVAITQCSSGRQQRAQGRVDTAQHGAQVESGADAVNTVSASDARERASEDQSRRNEEEIRNAEGSTAPVNPAARDAGLRSLCRRAAYRDNAKCKLLNAPAR